MIAQTLINGLIAASIYGLVGLGFALIYWTTRFFNFAHGAVFTAAAYCAYCLYVNVGLPLWLASVAAVAFAAVFGLVPDVFLFSQLRARRGSGLILMLVSLGVLIVFQNLVALLFGDDAKTFRVEELHRSLGILGARITLIQLWTIVIASGVYAATWLALRFTRAGLNLRAVANDPDLAVIVGIDWSGIIRLSFIAGSAITAIAALLTALDTSLTPTMGLRTLLLSVIAVLVGGQSNVSGVAIGAILVGMTQHLGVLYLSTAWQDTIVFVLLLVFLLTRPQGLLGQLPQRTTGY